MKRAQIEVVNEIVRLRKENPTWPGDKIAEIVGISKSMVNYHLRTKGFSKRSLDYAVKRTVPETYKKNPANWDYSSSRSKPGRIDCLRCDKPFDSPDKIAIRLCPHCNNYALSSYEDSYVVRL